MMGRPMPDATLSDRRLATLAAEELRLDERDLPSRARRRETIGRLALVAADMLAVTVSMFVVTLFPFSDAVFLAWVVVFLPLFALLAKMAGLYDRDQFVLHKTTLDEAPALVAVAAIFALAVEGVQAIQYTGGSHPLPLWAVLTVALVVLRSAARFVAVRTASPERVLVIGDADTAALVRRKLGGDPNLNATVVGRVGPKSEGDELADDVLGSIRELPAVLDEHRVERVVVAPAHQGGEDVVDVIRLVTACGVRVAVLPRMLEVIGTSVEFDDLGGQLLLGVRASGLSPSSSLLKRSFDVVVAGAMVIVLAPLLLGIALATKLGSGGPILFRQTRVGRHGREFQMLKFRTMVHGADERKHEVLALNQAAPMFKIVDDPRTTRLGRFLRRRSLDELPQLFNVLSGDMSLVGPRPLIPEEARLFSGWQRRRYHVAPGITGPWQILGSSRVPLSDMVKIDYLYCANWSLWLDAKILARTIPYVLSRRTPEHISTPR
jgi:exopolysaccharide biosynthesis polyprenyl glycosylphosphotransferase